MPKATTPVSARQGRRHNPLEDDLTATGPLKATKTGKRKSRHQDEGEQFVDSKSSRKILRMGQELVDEDQTENSAIKASTAFDFESRLEGDDDDEEDPEQTFEEFEEWDEEGEVETIELAPEDLETFNKFFPSQEDSLLRNGWPGAGGDEEAEEGPGILQT